MHMVNEVISIKKENNHLILQTEEGEYKIPHENLMSYQVDYAYHEIIGSCSAQLRCKLTLVLPYDSRLVFMADKGVAMFMLRNF